MWKILPLEIFQATNDIKYLANGQFYPLHTIPNNAPTAILHTEEVINISNENFSSKRCILNPNYPNLPFHTINHIFKKLSQELNLPLNVSNIHQLTIRCTIAQDKNINVFEELRKLQPMLNPSSVTIQQ